MKKLETAEKSINDLKEEARTTSVNYEEQLSMMSEHLANMNDKLTTQTDEIERLHFEMGNNKKVNKWTTFYIPLLLRFEKTGKFRFSIWNRLWFYAEETFFY